MDPIEEGQKLSLQFEKRGGVLPVAVQEKHSGDVLMIGYVNEEALKKTLEIGYATFWSTSRKELWTKGLTSGDKLKIEGIKVDCDQDALVYQVTLEGKGVCHTKNSAGNTRKACFYRSVNLQDTSLVFDEGQE